MAKTLRYTVYGEDGAVHLAGTPHSKELAGLFKDGDHLWSDVPTRSGAGSGREAWVAYAEQSGVTFEDDATRDEIVAALDAAGVPTE